MQHFFCSALPSMTQSCLHMFFFLCCILIPSGLARLGEDPFLGESEGCFSGATYITAFDRESDLSEMADLECGVEVLAPGVGTQTGRFAANYETIPSFLHRNSNRVATFLSIQTTNRTLEVTPMHRVFTCAKKTPKEVFAKDVRPGDYMCALLNDEEGVITMVPDKVARVGQVERRGVYAPSTSTGTLVVNDFFVSTFSGVSSSFTSIRAVALVDLVAPVCHDRGIHPLGLVFGYQV